MKTLYDILEDKYCSVLPDDTVVYSKGEAIEAMREYAELKVKEQRDLMATYLANHFNIRNVPKPELA